MEYIQDVVFLVSPRKRRCYVQEKSRLSTRPKNKTCPASQHLAVRCLLIAFVNHAGHLCKKPCDKKMSHKAKNPKNAPSSENLHQCNHDRVHVSACSVDAETAPGGYRIAKCPLCNRLYI